jgi:hypothetical protein
MISLPRVSPGRGLLATVGQIQATFWAEATMQWRRKGFWLAFVGATALLLVLTVQSAIYFKHLPSGSRYLQYTTPQLENVMIYGTTAYGSMFLGIVVALLVVDRLGRDRQLGMSELQRAAPQGYGRYLLGKFLGNYLAVIVPTFSGYLLCSLITILLGWPPVMIQKFLLAFLLIFVPGSFAAVGTTFLLASFLPIRVVQVGFSLLWFYLNIGIGWYGLAASIFNAGGLYVFPVFFPMPPFLYSAFPITTSFQTALLNIAVLLLTGVVAVILTCGSLAFQQYRKEKA